MILFGNNMLTSILITAFVAVFIILLPIIDRLVCRRIGLNLTHGISSNPNAEALLKLRQSVLYAVFTVYVAAFAFIVFFSRTTSEGYLIHAAVPLQDFRDAFLQLPAGLE